MDELYKMAKELVIQHQQASVSFLQRKLMVGYARASSLIDKLEEKGVIGKARGSEPREVFKK